ncbi:MAG: LytTR family DNA-binding domain-containing protein [Lachnospiraceae bacterium]|nr:LytTR family DNA-binding domain-containing protein [Lachnospiraceae bacterium]
MIRVMVVEDEEQIRIILGKMIEKNEGFKVVSSCADFASAISSFVSLRPEIVFMDIDLNGESGLECAKAICEVDPKVKIIFATAHSEYMANAFEIYAFDYIVKPFDMERIRKTLEKIKVIDGGSEDEEKHAPDRTEKLIIKGKEEINFVDIKDIIMIERTDGVTRIVTDTDVFLTSQSLSALEEKLNPEKFMRCHKSYIIRKDAIKKLEVYGRWTYVVKLKGCDETALITNEKYKELVGT